MGKRCFWFKNRNVSTQELNNLLTAGVPNNDGYYTQHETPYEILVYGSNKIHSWE